MSYFFPSIQDKTSQMQQDVDVARPWQEGYFEEADEQPGHCSLHRQLKRVLGTRATAARCLAICAADNRNACHASVLSALSCSIAKKRLGRKDSRWRSVPQSFVSI